MKALRALKPELLAVPQTRAAYDALADEFERAGELIAARGRAGLTQGEVAQRMGTVECRQQGERVAAPTKKPTG